MKKNTNTKLIVIILVVLSLQNVILGDDKASKLYKKGEFGEAIKLYDRIINEHPEWSEAHFGKGASLFRDNRIDEAVVEFEKAIPSKDPIQKSAAFYNIGNALMKSQKMEEALHFYQKSLELNPKDFDAKHNFELVKRMMQEQQKQNKDQQNKDKDKDKDKDKQQEQQQKENQENKKEQKQDQQKEEKKEEQKQDQQEQQQNKQDEKKQNQNENQPQPQPQEGEEKKMQKQEASKILDALKDNEKKMMKKRMKAKTSGTKKEKDW